MKRMIRTINASVWICSKACNKTVYKKHCTLFYGTFCGPASVFHEAVSICHTWLSNNPVVGQTKQNPGDITLKTFCWSILHCSASLLHSRSILFSVHSHSNTGLQCITVSTHSSRVYSSIIPPFMPHLYQSTRLSFLHVPHNSSYPSCSGCIPFH